MRKIKDESAQRVVFIDGKLLYLRPPCMSDLPLFVRWFNDPEIRGFINRQNPLSDEGEKKFIEQLAEKSDNIVLAIVLKGKTPKEDRPIGTIGIHNVERGNGITTTGAAIGERDCWGKGYGTAAKMIFLEHLFNTLNFRKIYSHVLSTNIRSRVYSEKCGYVLEATLPKHHFRKGSYVDVHILAVYADTWRPIWEKAKRTYLPL